MTAQPGSGPAGAAACLGSPALPAQTPARPAVLIILYGGRGGGGGRHFSPTMREAWRGASGYEGTGGELSLSGSSKQTPPFSQEGPHGWAAEGLWGRGKNTSSPCGTEGPGPRCPGWPQGEGHWALFTFVPAGPGQAAPSVALTQGRGVRNRQIHLQVVSRRPDRVWPPFRALKPLTVAAHPGTSTWESHLWTAAAFSRPLIGPGRSLRPALQTPHTRSQGHRRRL